MSVRLMREPTTVMVSSCSASVASDCACAAGASADPKQRAVPPARGGLRRGAVAIFYAFRLQWVCRWNSGRGGQASPRRSGAPRRSRGRSNRRERNGIDRHVPHCARRHAEPVAEQARERAAIAHADAVRHFADRQHAFGQQRARMFEAAAPRHVVCVSPNTRRNTRRKWKLDRPAMAASRSSRASSNCNAISSRAASSRANRSRRCASVGRGSARLLRRTDAARRPAPVVPRTTPPGRHAGRRGSAREQRKSRQRGAGAAPRCTVANACSVVGRATQARDHPRRARRDGARATAGRKHCHFVMGDDPLRVVATDTQHAARRAPQREWHPARPGDRSGSVLREQERLGAEALAIFVRVAQRERRSRFERGERVRGCGVGRHCWHGVPRSHGGRDDGGC